MTSGGVEEPTVVPPRAATRGPRPARSARSAVLVVALLAGCGSGNHPPVVALTPSGPKLPVPPPIDPTARGAAYLTAIATRVEPAWEQFLEDCRLRLPSSHPLNRPALEAIAELAIGPDGRVDIRVVAGSGNPNFDAAIAGVLRDATPMPIPPVDLLSDDGLVHVRWTFARDGRQAGPATANLLEVQRPLLEVVDRLLDRAASMQAGSSDRDAVARTATRIAAAPIDDPDRTIATERVMIAALRDGVASSNGAVRRAAIEAIGRANVRSLASSVYGLVAANPDVELRLAAIAATAALGDPAGATVLAADLPLDFATRPRAALAKVVALVALDRGGEAAAAIRAELVGPSPIGLAALALVPDPAIAPRLAGWFASKDARARAAVCSALPAAAPGLAIQVLTKGLRDPDATVRAACIAATVRGKRAVRDHLLMRVPAADPAIARELRALARDRDRGVRAGAIAVLGVVEPAHRLRSVDDPAPEVRAASAIGAAAADLRTLAADRDPDVRAAAVVELGDRDSEIVASAIADVAAPVRKAAIAALAADAELERLAYDDSADVATAALVKLASRRGREAITAPLLASLVATPGNGPERVRIALAWLLAR